MFSRIFVCLVFTWLFLSGCQAQEAGQAVKPAVQENDPYSFDFGVISGRESVSHEFTLKNEGTNTLNITGVTNGCGCTGSAISKNAIGPGESALLKVTFDPRGYKGEVTQFVYVNTDDPGKPVYRFAIRAHVK